jgi:hypothetical protein
MFTDKDVAVHARQNVISFAGDEIAERLAGTVFYRSTAILFPSAYALRVFRGRLQKRLPTIGGVRLYTSTSLRRELFSARHPDWQLLPAESLVPWQIENGFSPGAIREVQQLRPEDRARLCPNSLWARAESEKLFTSAALDIQLRTGAHQIIWDQFFSVGFSEGSWENYHLMQAAVKYASVTEHFFELKGESFSVIRWRKLWNYQPDDKITKKVSANLEVCIVENVTDFAFVILGKIASISAQYDRGKFSKIAIGFAGRNARYHALRQRLEIAQIPFLDLLEQGKIADWSPLWPRWVEYQKHQRREECLALLDCKFALGFIKEAQWKELCDRVLNHSRQNVTDDCGETLLEAVQEWVRPLPARGNFLEFWQGVIGIFPRLNCLLPDVQILSSLYDTLTREGFLGWLEVVVENQFREVPKKNWAANVHIVGYDDLLFGDFDHVICGDLAEHKSKNCAEIFNGMNLESINESLEDFYYDFSPHVTPLKEIIGNTLGRSCGITVVAIREIGAGGTDVPAAMNFENQLDSNEIRYLRRLGMIFDGTEDKIKNVSNSRDGDVARCVNAHRRRLDIIAPFGIYDFGVGGDEKWREELLRSMPCKAWELAFTCPEEVWMRQILRINSPGESVFDEIAMLIGTRVHGELAKNFTQIVPTQGKAECPPLAGFDHISHGVSHQSLGLTHALVKQTQMELAEFDPDSTKSEQNIAGFITIDAARIWVRGRVDLVANEGANYCVIDFKTRSAGTAFTAVQVSRGKFLQIVLYGLYYQFAGRTVGMRVLSPFQRARNFEFSKLKPKEAEKMDAFFANFEKLQRSMVLGYGTSGRFLAYAHSRLPAHIVNARRGLSGFAEDSGDDS